jgi:PiT family inorganic phosphate transporter
MGALFDPSLSTGRGLLLGFCILVALGFEFVNGFHDTANAVATVIYTNSLRPKVAVVLSGLFNFLGVIVSAALGGIAVAMGIVKLLPVELLVSSGAGAGLAMVLALLFSAILWNLGTWYFGIPASSSHTLIGAIIGVGLANSLTPGHVFGDGVNFTKASEIGLSLLISPIFGFGTAFLLLVLIRRYARNPALNRPPEGDQPPPRGTRSLLIFTSCAVSFAHGQNDGQKGVGLVMLILMGLVPAGFALNSNARDLHQALDAADRIEATLKSHADATGKAKAEEATQLLADIKRRLAGKSTVAEVPRDDRFPVRKDILLADKLIDGLVKEGHLGLSETEKKALAKDRKELRDITEYAPWWVMLAIALSLGIGTMVGWKRIVVTIGEKIGKSHLTYAQGASAELVAASTILLASRFGLPVSTTHVLSSGVAGTMVAQKSGLNPKTVRNIALAWVLTLPATILLAAGLFLLFRKIV